MGAWEVFMACHHKLSMSAFFVALSWTWFSSAAIAEDQTSGRRVALIIGNSYSRVAPSTRNGNRDGSRIADRLSQLAVPFKIVPATQAKVGVS